MAQNAHNIDFLASNYINEQVENEDEALQGARDIIAEWINETIFVRKQLRRIYTKTALITTKVSKSKKRRNRHKNSHTILIGKKAYPKRRLTDY